MSNYIPPKKDDKGIGSVIVSSVGKVVDAYNLSTSIQDTTTSSTATPPAGDPPSVSPGSSSDSTSASVTSAFRHKGRPTPPVKGQDKAVKHRQ